MALLFGSIHASEGRSHYGFVETDLDAEFAESSFDEVLLTSLPTSLSRTLCHCFLSPHSYTHIKGMHAQPFMLYDLFAVVVSLLV